MSARRHRQAAVALVAAFAGLAACRPALAQFAVIDVASVTQLVVQAQTLARQLEQAQAQVAQAQTLYRSLTGTRGMQQLLADLQPNYLPQNWSQLQASVQGLGTFSALNADVRAALSANAVLTATQLGALSPAAQAQIQAQRGNVALLQGLTQEALSNSSSRFASLTQLIQAIGTAQDQKAILDLQARIGAEQGMLQNEQTKLQTLYQAVAAQTDALRQQQHELALAMHGNFSTRFEPAP
jgi:type IV secretion system protein VirB5